MKVQLSCLSNSEGTKQLIFSMNAKIDSSNRKLSPPFLRQRASNFLGKRDSLDTELSLTSFRAISLRRWSPKYFSIMEHKASTFAPGSFAFGQISFCLNESILLYKSSRQLLLSISKSSGIKSSIYFLILESSDKISFLSFHCKLTLTLFP